MKILIYVRPVSQIVFSQIADICFGHDDKCYISDFKSCNVLWSGNYIYNSYYDYDDHDLDEFLLNDILQRDRTLRLMPRNIAEMLVRRYWNGINELFAKERFNYVLILPVDCYTLDVIDRIAKLYNVKVISFIGTFISNYVRFTVRGEFNDLHRDIADEEVDDVLNNLLLPTYFPEI